MCKYLHIYILKSYIVYLNTQAKPLCQQMLVWPTESCLKSSIQLCNKDVYWCGYVGVLGYKIFWNERDHKSCLSALIMRGQAKISFAHARGVSGACPVRLFEKLEKVFLAKLGHQSRKRAERGWKSEAGPLSWKSGWKPSISRWFWAIGGYCIFFPFRDMAILKCPLGRIKFPMLKYGPVECLIWGMFQWAKQAFIGTVQYDNMTTIIYDDVNIIFKISDEGVLQGH